MQQWRVSAVPYMAKREVSSESCIRRLSLKGARRFLLGLD